MSQEPQGLPRFNLEAHQEIRPRLCFGMKYEAGRQQ